MTKDVFSFRHFDIQQDQCAMKVGTDGVLVGAWAVGGQRVLDIGAGTGIISLMMAQRFPQANVEGVEADEQAARQAAENARSFPKVKIRHSRLQDFTPEAPYDSMVSNPPFFIDSLQTPDRQRTLARHGVDLSFADIISFANRWLTAAGQLSVVLPSDVADRFSETAYLSGFRIVRRTKIQTKSSKPFKRQLLAFSKDCSLPLQCSEHCLLSADGHRSAWYEELTKDFYIR